MRILYIRARHDCSAFELIQPHLPSGFLAEACCQAGGIWRNKVRLEADTLLSTDDVVIVYLSQNQTTVYSLASDYIVYENDAFLVAYKPPLVPACADVASLYHNQTWGVRAHLAESGNQFAASPITRLDYVTQGLMLYGKSPQAERQLSIMMQKRQIQKLYLAILESHEPIQEMHAKAALSFGHQARIDAAGKPCYSVFRYCRQAGHYPMYAVQLKTGRRHQIRAHAAGCLAPIVGDTLYGGKPAQTAGIALLAARYRFRYQGKVYTIRIPGQWVRDWVNKVTMISLKSV